MDHSVPDKTGKVHDQFLIKASPSSCKLLMVDRHNAKNLNKYENNDLHKKAIAFCLGLDCCE